MKPGDRPARLTARNASALCTFHHIYSLTNFNDILNYKLEFLTKLLAFFLSKRRDS